MAESQYISCAETAKLIRADLKRLFPQVKFSVTSKTYSGGASIRVKWVDGCTTAEVDAITDRYRGADFDGMQDLKTYRQNTLNGKPVHFGADYIHTERSFSESFMRQQAEKLAADFGVACPEVKVREYDQSAYINNDYDPEIIRRLGDTFSTVLWRRMKDVSALLPAAKLTESSAIVATQEADGWRITGNTYPHRLIFREVGAESVKGANKKHAYWLIKAETLPDSIAALLETPQEVTTSSPATKFRQMADALQKRIDAKRNSGTSQQNPTPRRMRMLDSMESDARYMERVQDKLRAIADAWDNDTISDALRGVRSKNVIECLLRRDAPPHAEHNDFPAMLQAGLINREVFYAARRALLELGNPEAGKKTDADLLRDKERDLVGLDIPGYFPTPSAIVEQMLTHANIRAGMKVLEPSAGKGNIADVIRQHHPEVAIEVCEINSRLTEILALKGYVNVARDFMSDPIPHNHYDRVLMNPPFEKTQDVMHVYTALAALKPGGVLVAIMSNAVTFRQDKIYAEFRANLEAFDHEIIELPEGAFKNSERPTGVNTVMVVIHKPEPKPDPVSADELAQQLQRMTTEFAALVSMLDGHFNGSKPLPNNGFGRWDVSVNHAYQSAMKTLKQYRQQEPS